MYTLTRSSNKCYINNKLVTEDNIISNRIKKLAIPPAWTSIEISKDPYAYLQVIGKDANNKTQYIYHPGFVAITQSDKYKRMKKLSFSIHKLQNNVDKIIREEKIGSYVSMVALMTKIMLLTYIRIGSESGKRESIYGLSTLERRHIKLINDDEIVLDFIGKKGVRNFKKIKNKNVYNYLKWIFTNTAKLNQSRLFVADGYIVTNNDVNKFIKENVGTQFSCKDIRTLFSNLVFIEALCSEKIEHENEKNEHENEQIKKQILARAYNKVATELCNTKYVSKKSYVTKQIEDLYLQNSKIFKNNSDSLLILQRI